MQLSKSDYLMYLRHPAWLWLKKHDKEKLPPFDANTQAILEAGHAFEQYAEALFPNGQRVGFDDFSQYRTMPARTKALLDEGATTLFQARFEHGQLTCIVDVLERVDGNMFDLYEIKSSTGVKDEHLDDLAFQLLVLEGAGMVVRNVGVIYVNSEYVRDGEIDPQGITARDDVTEQVRGRLAATAANVEQALAVLGSNTMPDISPRHAHQRALKDWLEIFRALRLDTDPFSIYELAPPDRDLLGELEDLGYGLVRDIPAAYAFQNGKHRRYVELVQLGKPVIQAERIKAFLDAFEYPLYFFDYETLSGVVPPFDGLRPYQQLPMQYSLHILREPGGELEHREFLHRDGTHPGQALIAKLQADIGESGSVITWNASFEKRCNEDLGKLFPEFAAFMQALNGRLVDLMVPFSRWWYEDYRFRGSASIKKVLPVLVPELSYKGMPIADGATAQRTWMEVVLDGKNPGQKEQILTDLLRYCELDTLAMVRIYEVLRAL